LSGKRRPKRKLDRAVDKRGRGGEEARKLPLCGQFPLQKRANMGRRVNTQPEELNRWGIEKWKNDMWRAKKSS